MNTDDQRPRLWVKLRRDASQAAPDLFGRVTRRPKGEWIEIRGYVDYPGEVIQGHEITEWSFWGTYDIDLSPIFKQNDVERIHVEPGHRHAERLRSSAAPFEVVVAEGPPAGVSS